MILINMCHNVRSKLFGTLDPLGLANIVKVSCHNVGETIDC